MIVGFHPRVCSPLNYADGQAQWSVWVPAADRGGHGARVVELMTDLATKLGLGVTLLADAGMAAPPAEAGGADRPIRIGGVRLGRRLQRRVLEDVQAVIAVRGGDILDTVPNEYFDTPEVVPHGIEVTADLD